MKVLRSNYQHADADFDHTNLLEQLKKDFHVATIGVII
jgi:hypothetical protein